MSNVAWGKVEEGLWHLASETLSETRPAEGLVTYRGYLDSVHPMVKEDSEEAKKANQESQ